MKVKKILMILATTAVLSASAMGLVGCGHQHNFGTELKSDATNHYYQCECGEKKDSAEHQASAVYSSDETNHWKECSDCGYDLSLEAHNYNQEVVTDGYLKIAATATTKAVYYKSCVCGKSGTETFEADKTAATITNLVMTGKTYDGTAVAAPTFDKNTDGTAVVEYKVKNANDNTYTTTAPTNAGEYTVRVTIAQTTTHTSVSSTKDFTIAKYAIKDLTLYSVYNGTENHTIDLSSIAEGLTLDVIFGSRNVGATVNSVTVKVNSQETANYEIVMEGDDACSLNIEPKELNVNWAPNTFVFVHDGMAKVPTAEPEGVCSGDFVDLTLTLAAGDSNTDVGSFEYVASINDTNYYLANPNATFRIINPEFSTDGSIPLGIPYFRINLAEGDYYIDSSTLSVDGPTNFELKFYYTSDLEKTTPVFTVDSLTNCSINITDAIETSFYVEISYAGYSGSFVIKEDDHTTTPTINEMGFCVNCNKFLGVVADTNTNVDLIMSTGDKAYFRFDITGDITDPDLKLNIKFEDEVSVTYTAYDADGNVIDLTTNPASFVATESVYVVIEALQDIDTMVQVEQTY